MTDATQSPPLDMAEALRREKAFSEAFIEGAPGVFYVIDDQARLLRWNSYLHRLTGFSDDELANNDGLRFVHPDDRERVMTKVREAMDTGYSQTQARLLSRDLGPRDYFLTGRRFAYGGTAYIVGFGLDLTDRHRTEQALKASEQKYRTLVDTLHEGIWVIDRDANTVFVNPRMAEMLGYAPEEMQGRALSEFMDERVRKSAAENITRRQQGISEQHDFEFLRKDGSHIYTSLDATPLYDLDGEYIGALAGVSDMTDRRLAEEALRHYADEVEDLYNRAPIGYHSLDRAGVIIRINDTELAWLGYTREEVVGKKRMTELMSAESVADFQKNFPRFLREGAIRDLEFELVRKDGSHLPVLLSATAVYDERGEFQMSRTTVYDLSDRKAAELALAESEERYRSVVDALFEGILLVGPDNMIRATNRSAERLLGLSEDEIAGRTPMDPRWQAIREDGSPFPAAERPTTTALRTGKAERNVPMGVHRPDGTVVWLLTSAQPLFHAGETTPYAVVVSFVDITDRKDLERRLTHQAQTDYLTGIANRRRFMELAHQELVRCRRFGHPLSLLMFDIDHFKQVNDSYGHAAGDRVLSALADQAQHGMREVDVLGRLGGEEFGVLLPETPLEKAIEVAERLRQQVAATQVGLDDGRVIAVTASIGVAMLGPGNDDIDALLSRADDALYRAKSGGRNRVEHDGEQPGA